MRMPSDHLDELAGRKNVVTRDAPVDRLVVALGGHDLGRQVVGGTAEGPCDVGHLLGEAKVGDLEVAVAVEQQVLGLQVAVDDVVRVQVVEGQGDLGGVELGDGVGEALGLAQQTEQLAALDKVHDHVQVLGVLEGAPQGDEERVLDLLQHAALVVGVLDLLHLDDLGLFQHLDGVEALVVLALDEVHASKGAGAEGALDGEVGQRVLALCDAGQVEGLRLELHAGVPGGIAAGGLLLLLLLLRGAVGGVYQVLYAGDVVRGLLLGRVAVGARDGVRAVGGVHRVGRLVRRGRGGIRGRLLRVRLRVGLLVGEGAVVGARLGQVEGARGAVLGGGWGDGRARRGFFDGRRRRIEVLGAARVLRPLLLEEAEGRHTTGGCERWNARRCPGERPWERCPGEKSCCCGRWASARARARARNARNRDSRDDAEMRLGARAGLLRRHGPVATLGRCEDMRQMQSCNREGLAVEASRGTQRFSEGAAHARHCTGAPCFTQPACFGPERLQPRQFPMQAVNVAVSANCSSCHRRSSALIPGPAC